jgi:hypothetical protein
MQSDGLEKEMFSSASGRIKTASREIPASSGPFGGKTLTVPKRASQHSLPGRGQSALAKKEASNLDMALIKDPRMSVN